MRCRDLLRLVHRGAADPASEHVALRVLGRFAYRRGDLGARRERRRRIDCEHGICFGVGQHRSERCRPVCRCDVCRQGERIGERRARAQKRVQLLHRVFGQCGEPSAGAQQRIGGNAPEAVTVGDDSQALAEQRTHPRHRLGRIEQVLHGVQAHPAGAAQGRFVDIVGAEWRIGEASALDSPAADSDDRLVARRGARRRHELASDRNRVELHQDGLGFRICRQPVEHVREIDIDAGAQVQYRREADPLAAGAVEHCCRDRGRLRDQRDLSARCGDVGHAGVETACGNEQACASRSEHTYQVRPGCIENGLAHLRQLAAGHLVQPRRSDDYRACATGAELGDDARDIRERRADDRQIRHDLGFADVDMGADPEQRTPFRADGNDRAGKSAGGEIAQHYLGVAARFVGLGDDRDRFWMKQEFEIADSHC